MTGKSLQLTSYRETQAPEKIFLEPHVIQEAILNCYNNICIFFFQNVNAI